VLRPRLGPRIVLLTGSVLLLALSLAAALSEALIGVPGVLLFGFATANAALRVFHPRSYATELDGNGFRTFDALGRPVHEVAWRDITYLTVFAGNGLRGAGTALHLAWRSEPPSPGRGRQPWVRGGRDIAGERFDGALPDPYLGADTMLALFKGRADAARG
jgi:hypothetical protein